MFLTMTPKKARWMIITGSILCSLIAPVVHASVYGGNGLLSSMTPLAGISSAPSIRSIIIKIILFILDFVLILAVVAIIIAGIYLITSAGDEGQKDKAKKIIYYALIGIVLVLMSRVIVSVVNQILG